MVEQVSDGLEATFPSRHQQRRSSVVFLMIDQRATAEQLAHDMSMSEAGGLYQCGRAVGAGVLDVDAMSQQFPHQLRFSLSRRLQERRAICRSGTWRFARHDYPWHYLSSPSWGTL